MAGGRRATGSRNTPNPRVQEHSVGSKSSCSNVISHVSSSAEDKRNEQLSMGRTLAPKHVPLPQMSVDSQILFEVVSFIAVIVATCMQLLNLYRSVWWLPQSYNDYSINFYLIDPYLIIFICTLSARQFVYAVICKSMDVIAPVRWVPILQRIMRVLLLMVILSVLLWCLYYISERHNCLKVFYLCYPISIYFLIFGAKIEPFFDATTPSIYIKEDKKTKYFLDKPMHNCSVNASAIRAEVANLRSDFNRRLKRALFSSFGSAYLCGIAPLIFVPQHLHFDVGWVVQYVVLIWLSRVGAYFSQAYPVRYCDVLHRAALHLGKWARVDVKIPQISIQGWNDAVLWPHGSLIKHNKEFYRSEGLCTAAEPGNANHSRFYALFSNPTIIQCFFLAMELTLVAVQLMILFHTNEWYRVMSLSLLIVTNLYTLYRLTRDYLICWRVYRAEQIVQEKAQMAQVSTTQ